MPTVTILDKKGDTKNKWNTSNDDEIEAARAQFKVLKDKGFTAFYVEDNGKKGERMDTFDEDAGEFIMIPRLVGG